MRDQTPIAYARANRARFVAELQDFVRFPSIGGQPQHARDVHACAGWLATHLRRLGLDRVEMTRTGGHPIVTAEWLRAPGRPTLLVYGHYDVQPAEPLEAWRSPPFHPLLHEGRIHGRGSSDDKGQMFAHVKAIECWLHANGSLPVNVRCLFEGEEEIGSKSLPAFLDVRADTLSADLAVLSDNVMLGPGRPVVTESLRGSLSLELEFKGPQRELHSGNYGGAIHNPLQALCEVLSKLHDERGRVAIPGFYDRVRCLNDRERAYMRAVGPSDAEILGNAAAPAGWGEAGYTLYERTTIRPALTINGMGGGYQGAGVKAVIPPSAYAKLNFRLAADQDPPQIGALFRAHLKRLLPPAINASVVTQLGAKPVMLDRDHPGMRAAVAAYSKGFGVRPVFVRSGGTIPAVSLFREKLGIATVLMGFALPADGLHGPNESFPIANFLQGTETAIHFLAQLVGIGLRAPHSPRGVLAAANAR
jgi:acetylornithine deacetylase/succinyl-diaminopimelate desuccinylase-like protein